MYFVFYFSCILFSNKNISLGNMKYYLIIMKLKVNIWKSHLPKSICLLPWIIDIVNSVFQYLYIKQFSWTLRSCTYLLEMQKHPSRGFLRKNCSENMQQIYRRTSMLKCDFNKVAKHICICCIFSEHIFSGTLLTRCFYILKPKKIINIPETLAE